MVAASDQATSVRGKFRVPVAADNQTYSGGGVLTVALYDRSEAAASSCHGTTAYVMLPSLNILFHSSLVL